MQQLILGSSSPFRAQLLDKLQLNYITFSPDIDESSQSGETPEHLVKRLSEQKALAVAQQFGTGLIIASDQVAIVDGNILGKPGNHENAINQLSSVSGKTVRFLTGLALYNAQSNKMQSLVEHFDVSFRELTSQQIDFYLKQEKPYNCAGSFKSEGFGISLFSRLQGDDPNTLIGLPLIKLIDFLANEGVFVLCNNDYNHNLIMKS
jgi:septum formation protein